MSPHSKEVKETMSYDHGNNESTGGSDEQSSVSTTGSANGSKQKAPKAQLVTCSLCGQSFDRAATKTMPFCSKRCQQIDLGRWMNESYGLPFEGNGGPEGFDIPSDNDE